MNQSNKKIDKILSAENLPPLLADSFLNFEIKWDKIEGVNFENMGRVLTCHLLIEHHIEMFIKLESNKSLDFANSRLTFSQKLSLIGKIEAFNERGIIKGYEKLNKLRNRFSHSLKVEIEKNDINFLKDVILKINPENRELHNYSDLAIIELFTLSTCAFMAGYCTKTVHKLQKLTGLTNFLNEKLKNGEL